MGAKRLDRAIRTMREAKGLTQEQIAKRAQVGQSYLAMLESGERKNPSLAVLKGLAKALKVTLGELME
jgi:transcriptional regulator with XRE-family HTH domain